MVHCRYIITMHLCQLAVNFSRGKILGGYSLTVPNYEFLRGTKFPTLLPLHINLSHELTAD
jgi:hypothetical protein